MQWMRHTLDCGCLEIGAHPRKLFILRYQDIRFFHQVMELGSNGNGLGWVGGGVDKSIQSNRQPRNSAFQLNSSGFSGLWCDLIPRHFTSFFVGVTGSCDL